MHSLCLCGKLNVKYKSVPLLLLCLASSENDSIKTSVEEFQNTSIDLVNSRKRESTDDDSDGPCTKKIAFGVLLYVALPSMGAFPLGGPSL